MTFKNIDPEKLYSTDFWQALLELQMRYLWDSSSNVGPGAFYGLCEHYLQGRQEPPHDPEAYPFAYNKPQRAGTCVAKGILRSCELMWSGILDGLPTNEIIKGHETYKLAKVLWQSYYLVKNCKKYLPEGEPLSLKAFPDINIRLIEDISANLRQGMKKLLMDELMPKALAIELEATLDDIACRIAERTNALSEKASSIVPPPMDLTFLAHKPLLIDANMAASSAEAIPLTSSNDDDLIAFRLQATCLYERVRQLTAQPEKMQAHALMTMTKDFSELPGGINKLSNLSQLKKFQNVLLTSLKAFISLFPFAIDSRGAAFWKEIDHKKAEGFIDDLLKIMKFLALSKSSPEVYLMRYTCLATIDHLVRRQPENRLDGWPQVCCQQFWNRIISTKFILTTKSEETRLFQLMYYFATPQVRGNSSAKSAEWQQKAYELLFCRPFNAQDKLAQCKQLCEKEEHSLFFEGICNKDEHNIEWGANLILDEGNSNELPTWRFYRQWLDKIPTNFIASPLEKLAKVITDTSLLPKNIQQLRQATLLALRVHPGPLKYEVKGPLKVAIIPQVIYVRKYQTPLKIDLQNEIIADQSTISIFNMLTLTLEETREIKLLGADPYSSAMRALTFFQQRVDLLQYSFFREQLRAHLFRAGALTSQLSDCPSFGEYIGAWLTKVLDHYAELGQWRVWLHLALLGQEIKDFVADCGHLPNSFPDICRNICEKVLPRCPPAEELLAYRVLILMHRINPGHTDPTFEQITAYYGWKVAENRLLTDSVNLEDEIILIPMRWEKICQAWVAKASLNDITPILDSLLEQVAPSPSGKWINAFPFFVKDRYSVNLETGTICGPEGDYTVLPLEVKQDRRFQRLCGGAIREVFKVSNGQLKVVSNEGTEKKPLWHETFIRYGQSLSFLRTIEGFLSEARDMPLQLTGLMPERFPKDLFCWQGKSGTWKILPTGKQPGYHIETKFLGQYITSIQRDDGFYYEPPECMPPAIRQIIIHLGAMNLTEIWRSDKTIEVSLFKQSLHFDIAIGSDKASVREYEGFFLSDDQRHSLPEGVPGLVIENGRGAKRLLVQYNKWNRDFEENNGLVKISLAPNVFKIGEWAHLAYQYDGKQLKPCDLQGELYLVYLAALAADYEEAISLLGVIRPLMHLSKAETELIEWLIGLAKKMQDEASPSSAVLWLKVLLFRAHNEYLYPQSSSPNLGSDLVYSFYKQYLKLEGNAARRLTIQEELTCQQIIRKSQSCSFEDLERRKAFLESGCVDMAIYRIITKKSNVEIDFNNFLHHFDWFLSKTNIELNYSIKEDDFIRNFEEYYRLATEGSKDKVERLKVILALNYPQTEELYTCWSILSLVASDPSFYPSWDNLKNNMEKLKWLYNIFAKKHYNKVINIIKKPFISNIQRPSVCPFDGIEMRSWRKNELSRTDREFEDFLQRVVKDHFTVEKLPPILGDCELPEEHSDKAIAAKLKQENNSLRTYRSGLKAAQSYTLQKPKALEEELRREVACWKVSLQSLKKALLSQANMRGVGRPGAPYEGQGRRQAITWHELRQLCCGDAIHLFRRSRLDSTGVSRLIEGYGDYLVKYTRLQQMQQALTLLLKKEAHGDQRLAELLLTKRSYPLTYGNRGRLQFEGANGLLYRPEQIARLEAITRSEHHEVSVEAPTGFGKSKVLIPSLNDEMSGKKLIINIWPASLELTNTRDMQKVMAQTYDRGISRLMFDRNAPFTAEGLELLYSEMKSDITKKGVLNGRSDALRALELHTLLLLDAAQLAPPDSEGIRKIAACMKILRLWRLPCWTCIDEAHINMAPNDNLIYPMDKGEKLPQAHFSVIHEVFDWLIKTHPQIDIRNNRQPENLKYFHNVVAPQCATYFATWLGLKAQEIKPFCDYATGAVPLLPVMFNDHPKKEEIYLVKGLLQTILPSALGGYVNVHYGLPMRHKSKHFSIPYVANNIAKENDVVPSQYKNPHEALVKTYITYFYQKLGEDQVVELLKLLQQQAVGEGRSLHETAAYGLFRAWQPDQTKGLCLLTAEEMKLMAGELKSDIRVIYYYIEHCVLPQILFYPLLFVSDAQNFRSMFGQWMGASATPPTATSLGPKTYFIPMAETAGKATHDLLKKGRIIIDGDGTDALATSIAIAQNNPRCRAIVDIGTQYRGIKSSTVAQALKRVFSHHPEIQEIIYFDEETETFNILNIATGRRLTLDESVCLPEQRLTYYDQARTFASDIKQAIDAIALVLFGLKTTKDEMAQGAGRMRELSINQALDILVPKNLQSQVFGSSPPSMGALLAYCIANQAPAAAFNEYLSQRQQLDNEMRRPLVDMILGLPYEEAERMKLDLLADDDVDVTNAIKLYGAYKPLLIKRTSCSAERLYGGSSTPISSYASLKNLTESNLKAFSSLPKVPEGAKSYLSKKYQTMEARWPTLHMVAEVPAHTEEIGNEVDVLQDSEQETDQQQHVSSFKWCIREPWRWPEDFDPFLAKWEASSMTSVAMRVSILSCKIIELFIHFAIALPIAICSIKVFNLREDFPKQVAIIFVATIATAFILKTTKKLHSLIVKPLPVPLFSFSEILAYHLPAEMKRMAKLFSSKLLVSNNYYTEKTTTWEETRQKAFDEDQKPLYRALVVAEGTSANLDIKKMILLDQTDSSFFARKLQKDRLKDPSIKGPKICLYDIEAGRLASQGAKGFIEGELESLPDFQDLLLEVRMAAGFAPTPQERPRLAAKAAHLGLPLLKRFYLDFLLARRPHQRILFTSDMHWLAACTL